MTVPETLYFSRIAGTGGYLPNTIVTNADLEKRIDTSDAWIIERTGIKQRHIVDASDTCTTMAIAAAREALVAANITPGDVDMIVVATCTPDKVFPSTACLVQAALGVPPGIAFDVQAACSGYIYALSVADNAIRLGLVKKALVIGSEVMSRGVDWTDRKTCILFGDGAGAVVLEASTRPGILSVSMGADGREKEILCWDNQPGSIFNTKRAVAIKAPVLPALTHAPATPSFTRLIATRIEESFFLRKATAGSSPISTI